MVQFYEADPFLLDALAAYVQAGLDAGDVCLVVASDAHRCLDAGEVGKTLDKLTKTTRREIKEDLTNFKRLVSGH